MVDSHTQQRMVVNGEALNGSNIIVPPEQLEQVTAALTREAVKFWVKKQLIYPRVRPPVAIVSLSRTSNTAAVQQLLDSI